MVLFNIQIDNFAAQSNVRWMGVLHNALEILPRQSKKQFFPPSVQEELVNFIKKLGYVDPLTTVSQVVVNKLHQPYRKILSIFNKSLTGQASGIDRARESIVQILTESDRDSNHGAESDNFDSVDSDKDNSDKNRVVDFMIRPHAKEPESKQPEPQLHTIMVTLVLDTIDETQDENPTDNVTETLPATPSIKTKKKRAKTLSHKAIEKKND
nr:hypothetical protein [Tanacetum cinerariifolium]